MFRTSGIRSAFGRLYLNSARTRTSPSSSLFYPSSSLLPSKQRESQSALMSTSVNQSKHVISKSLTFCNNNSCAIKQNQQKATLVIMFAWMLANDKHLEKYNQLYSKYGYDVLFVKTFPLQLLLPKFGAIKNAEDVIKFVTKSDSNYSNIIVHGFSVGAYQFGEVLVKITENKNLGPKLYPLFKGCILDSAVDMDSIPFGFSRAITSNRLLQSCIYYFLVGYLKLFYYTSTKYYQASQDQVFQMYHFQVPGLILVSEKDPVASVSSNNVIAGIWRRKGIPTTMKVWKDSKHVSHYYKYPDEYKAEVDRFLKQINPDLVKVDQ